ncbi:hypothetical protein [Arsenicibacter rosenii]|uniref:Uncharacterized protein n=1 Tax=Arsenicibacter rosenii TaxID=1750698 RepID=A0A1S2V9M1_9BACT|nr:hypothetical protein [Arsenicibacter rosenii]OIN55437.1 hypothetical protein BLX24_30730 [Arsenicibacter rosenii]
MEKTITRRAMFAEIHQDTREEGKSHVFSIRYIKKDGTTGEKMRVRKSTKRLPGESGYRGNVNQNHVLLMENLDNGNQPFEVLIDLITHYNGMRVIHNY